MKKYKIITICASSVIAIGLGVMCHESAHVIAGWMMGGSPTLMTATEVRGDFSALSPVGFVALGISGSIINLLFCILGWWGLNRKATSDEFQLFAWFFFAVNGMLVTMKMVFEPLIGIGDWMTILGPFQAITYLRILVTALGVAGMVLMVRRSGALLAMLIPSGETSDRRVEAFRIVLIGAIASILLVLGSSIANPAWGVREILLALGAGLGPFIPMIFSVRFVSRYQSKKTTLTETGKWPLFWGAGITIITMWFIFGPGITLSNFLS